MCWQKLAKAVNLDLHRRAIQRALARYTISKANKKPFIGKEVLRGTFA